MTQAWSVLCSDRRLPLVVDLDGLGVCLASPDSRRSARHECAARSGSPQFRRRSGSRAGRRIWITNASALPRSSAQASRAAFRLHVYRRGDSRASPPPALTPSCSRRGRRAIRGSRCGQAQIVALVELAEGPRADHRFRARGAGRRFLLANVWHARELYRAMAIERFAAEIVDDEGIDLIHSHFGWPGSFGGMLAAAATKPPARRVPAWRRHPPRRPDWLRAGAVSHFTTVRSGACWRRADRTVYFSAFMRDCAIALGAPVRPHACRRKGGRLVRGSSRRRIDTSSSGS